MNCRNLCIDTKEALFKVNNKHFFKKKLREFPNSLGNGLTNGPPCINNCTNDVEQLKMSNTENAYLHVYFNIYFSCK